MLNPKEISLGGQRREAHRDPAFVHTRSSGDATKYRTMLEKVLYMSKKDQTSKLSF